jgi:aminoglycoside phosphotransferase (APT) family kinase protein
MHGEQGPGRPGVDVAVEYLDALAVLHASTWDAAFLEDLSWLTISLAEDDMLRHFWDVAELEHYLYKEGRAEVVDPALHDARRLQSMFESLAPIAARRPRSVLHGDTHIGNTYRDSRGRAGFLDWQGASSGPWVRDVSYFLASNLTVGDRGSNERALLAYYLGRLASLGVTPPRMDEAWTEYRRWMILPLLVWIRKSDRCQSREANRLGTQRASTAVMELEVLKLLG